MPIYCPDRPNDGEFIARLNGLNPDVLIAIGYTNILKKPILELPRRCAVNFHASLLPAYRGKHPVFWCLRNGERWSGLTVHIMDEGIDSGDILYQVKVRTRRTDTVASLYERILSRSLALIPRLVEEVERGAIRPEPQEQSGASYHSSIREEDFQIDWGAPAESIRRWIAITPGECFTTSRGERIFFMDAEVTTIPAGKIPGEIVKIGRELGVVAARDGGLRFRRVRYQNGEVGTFGETCHRLGLREGKQI